MKTSSNWSRESLAWLAGLLEGEGSFVIRNRYHYPAVQLNMTDEDVIHHAHKVAGLGTVSGPYNYTTSSGKPKKPSWFWSITGQDDAYAMMVAVYPWMGERRQQRIRDILVEWLANWRPPLLRDSKGRILPR